MSDLTKAVQGIHGHCPKCECVMTGWIVIHNDDNTGYTTGISVVCDTCGTPMMEFPPTPQSMKPSVQGELNV